MKPHKQSCEHKLTLPLKVDALLCNHPHVIQEAEYDSNFLFTASLGSVSQTPDGEYKDNPLLPYYSMAINLYLNTVDKKIDKVTFTLIKAMADENRYIHLFTVDELYKQKPEMQNEIKKDVAFLYERITKEKLNINMGVEREYEL